MKVFIQHTDNVRNDSADLACNMNELEKVPAAIATELLCEDVLDFVPNRLEFLGKLLSKLRYGGKISLVGIDIDEVARSLMNRQINVDVAANFLYSGRLSGSCVGDMTNILEQNGIKVLTTRLQNNHYYILAERNAIK